MYFCRPNKMKRNILNIFGRTWGLMMSTTSTWEEIAAENDRPNGVFRKFVLPWVCMVSLFILIFDAIYADSNHIRTGLINAVIAAVSLVGAYYIPLALTNSFFRKKMMEHYDGIQIEKIIGYSFAVLYVIRVVTSVIPSLFFLHILDVYTIYIVWEGSRILFNADEDERSKIMLIIGLSIIFTPAIIKKIILFMLPAF